MTLNHRPADERQRDVTERVATAALLAVLALGAVEQVRYRWTRAHHTAHRWWADVEHGVRDDMLRAELRTVAGVLIPVIGSRAGRRQP